MFPGINSPEHGFTQGCLLLTVDSDNALSPDRRSAITWTNAHGEQLNKIQ